MMLYLIRHGIAENAHESPEGSDHSRRLTEEGIRKTREAMVGLAQFVDRPDIILTSPRVRAMQTAELVAESLGAEVEVMDQLGESELMPILSSLARRSEGVIALVGHEPTFSGIVEYLTFGRVTGTVQMKKAGVAGLDVSWADAGISRGELVFLATPKMLRELA